MKKLQVGDHVLTSSSNEDGSYEVVYAFGHKDANKVVDFISLYTNDQTAAPLQITAEHMLFLLPEETKRPKAVPASSIKVGDVLWHQDGTSTTTVTKIRTVQGTGVYSPLTPSGTIIVNGIVASTYNSLQGYAEKEGGYFATIYSNQALIHLVNAPFRLLCLGISSTLCQSQNFADDLPYYISWGNQLSRWTLRQGFALQVMVLAVVGGFCGFCMLLEGIVGARWGPLMLGWMVSLAAAAFIVFQMKSLAMKVRIAKKKKIKMSRRACEIQY